MADLGVAFSGQKGSPFTEARADAATTAAGLGIRQSEYYSPLKVNKEDSDNHIRESVILHFLYSYVCYFSKNARALKSKGGLSFLNTKALAKASSDIEYARANKKKRSDQALADEEARNLLAMRNSVSMAQGPAPRAVTRGTHHANAKLTLMDAQSYHATTHANVHSGMLHQSEYSEKLVDGSLMESFQSFPMSILWPTLFDCLELVVNEPSKQPMSKLWVLSLLSMAEKQTKELAHEKNVALRRVQANLLNQQATIGAAAVNQKKLAAAAEDLKPFVLEDVVNARWLRKHTARLTTQVLALATQESSEIVDRFIESFDRYYARKQEELEQ